MICAGIDTGKRKLDVALEGRVDRLQVDNTAEGHVALSDWLRQHQVERVGIEASGGYEREVVAHLRGDGFVVIVFQPAQVRAYARFVLQRAKNDRIDASLIAASTAATGIVIAGTPGEEELRREGRAWLSGGRLIG
jgi:transposase